MLKSCRRLSGHLIGYFSQVRLGKGPLRVTGFGLLGLTVPCHALVSIDFDLGSFQGYLDHELACIVLGLALAKKKKEKVHY